MKEWPMNFSSAPLSFKTFQQWLETPCAPMTSMKAQYKQHLKLFLIKFESYSTQVKNSVGHIRWILRNPVLCLSRSRPTRWGSLLVLPWRKNWVSEKSLWGWSEKYWNGVHCFCCYVLCLWPQRYCLLQNVEHFVQSHIYTDGQIIDSSRTVFFISLLDIGQNKQTLNWSIYAGRCSTRTDLCDWPSQIEDDDSDHFSIY